MYVCAHERGHHCLAAEIHSRRTGRNVELTPFPYLRNRAVHDGERVVALAYVRREVPEDAELELGDTIARALDSIATRP